MNNKKKCFVIMPVSKTKSCTEGDWTGIFEHMIKPAVKGCRLGFDCERAKPRTGAFIKDILDGLNRADVVIADLTDRNPNVCYELGIRHTLKKRTLLITQNMNDVPSDLQSYWVVTYEKDLTGAEKFKRRVREILREIEKNPEKSDSPVADFLELKNIDILSYEKKTNLRKLSALISELSENLLQVDILTKRLKEIQEERKTGRRKYTISLVFYNACLELLLTTQYMLLPKDLLNSLNTVKFDIYITNKFLYLLPEFEDRAENFLLGGMPDLRKHLIELLKALNKVYLDYMNDNYIEPVRPTVILSSPEHQEYLQIKE